MTEPAAPARRRSYGVGFATTPMATARTGVVAVKYRFRVSRARARAAPRPAVSIRRRRRGAMGTLRREPIETAGRGGLWRVCALTFQAG